MHHTDLSKEGWIFYDKRGLFMFCDFVRYKRNAHLHIWKKLLQCHVTRHFSCLAHEKQQQHVFGKTFGNALLHPL